RRRLLAAVLRSRPARERIGMTMARWLAAAPTWTRSPARSTRHRPLRRRRKRSQRFQPDAVNLVRHFPAKSAGSSRPALAQWAALPDLAAKPAPSTAQ